MLTFFGVNARQLCLEDDLLVGLVDFGQRPPSHAPGGQIFLHSGKALFKKLVDPLGKGEELPERLPSDEFH